MLRLYLFYINHLVSVNVNKIMLTYQKIVRMKFIVSPGKDLFSGKKYFIRLLNLNPRFHHDFCDLFLNHRFDLNHDVFFRGDHHIFNHSSPGRDWQ